MSTAKVKTGGAQLRHVRDRLFEALGPLVNESGFDLEDLNVSSAGQRRVIRAVIDSDNGLDLDDVAAVSEQISAALDSTEFASLVPEPYVLEVTSPGTDRPLTQERHWRRATGRLVSVEVAGKPVTGRIKSATADEIELEVGGTVKTFALSELSAGRIQIEFNRPDAVDETRPESQEQ